MPSPLVIVTAYLATIAVIVVAFLLFRRRLHPSPDAVAHAPAPRPHDGPARADRGGLARMRRLAPAPDEKEREEKRAVDDDEEDAPEGEEDARLPAGNKKAQRKAEKKAQREAYRQFVLQQDELKRRKEAARLEASQRRDEEHDAAEAADAAALHLAAADAQRRAEEELAEWETAFTVEDAGEMEGETDPTTDEQSVEELVHWVVARKAVLVDEVALRWGLSTAEAKERMRALEENGRLKGVWDERGRWLELREEEWEAVRRWLADSGRVGVRELTAAVNRLVDCRERSGEDEGNDGAEDVYDEKDGT